MAIQLSIIIAIHLAILIDFTDILRIIVRMTLQFDKKAKRDKAITVRLSEKTIDQLKSIVAQFQVSQADVIETLIDKAHSEMLIDKKKKK